MGENTSTQLAARAADHADRVLALGSQLDMFAPPKPADASGEADQARGAGRPKGARNKVKRDLARLLAAHGYRDPAQQLAQLAALHQPDRDPLQVALDRARLILEAGRVHADCSALDALKAGAATEAERKRVFELTCEIVAEDIRIAHAFAPLVVSILKEQRQAASELMPYCHGKVSPDVLVNNTAQMVVQMAAPGAAGSGAERVGPPPMVPREIEQNQSLSEGGPEGSDG